METLIEKSKDYIKICSEQLVDLWNKVPTEDFDNDALVNYVTTNEAKTYSTLKVKEEQQRILDILHKVQEMKETYEDAIRLIKRN